MKLAQLAVCMAFFAFIPGISAQETATPERTGYPQDWSQRHIVFSREGLAQHPNLIDLEPRIKQQAAQRWQVPNYGSFHSADPLSAYASQAGTHRDWSIDFMAGHVAFNMFPAKFSFYPDVPPSCTDDFVVMGLVNSSFTSGRPNLVAFNNLYSNTVSGGGLCDPPTGPGPGPSVLFAYGISTIPGGHIITSPILSLDGKKIGFIESEPANLIMGTSAETIFHVLTWTAGDGSLTTGATPVMTTLPISLAVGNFRSSPWIDYSNDTVYVGTDDGNMHKITGVFKTLSPSLDPPPFPVSPAAGIHFTGPVLDKGRGVLMVGSSSNGDLYQIDVTTGAVAALSIGSGPSSGIVAPPVVDVTNGTTFVVDADDGTSAVLAEVDTATVMPLATGRIGIGGFGGAGVNLYEPAFSNDYFTDPSTGVVRVCGTGPTDTSPWQYAFGFTGRTMNTTPLFSAQLVASLSARCTGWTEFFNPNINALAGGTDYFFFGLTQDCTSITSDSTSGCVGEITNTNTTPVFVTINGGPSGIVVDGYSTAAQASSIYFTAWKQNTAYKLTQNGLQ